MHAPTDPPTLTEIIARALWLVDLPLVDERTAAAEPTTAIYIRLTDMADMDDAMCRRVVERCFKPEPPALADNLAILTRHCFELQQGLPHFKADEPLRRLSRLIDPDALVCLDARLRLPEDDRYNWPGVPMGDGGKIAALLRFGSVESHIHLGGALPPLYYWVTAMSGQVPLEQFRLYPTNRKPGNAAAEIWRNAIHQALFLRLRLAARVQTEFCRRGVPVFAHLPTPRLPGERDSRTPGLRTRCSCSQTTESHWGELVGRSRLPTWSTLRDLALNLSRPQRFAVPASQRCCALVDPLRFDFDQERHCHYAEGERRLLVFAARLLRDAETASLRTAVAQDLLAYLRIRNAFHQKLAHDHGADGLLSFEDSFSRRKFCTSKKRGARHQAQSGPAQEERRSRRRKRLLRLNALLEQNRMTTALDEQLHAAFYDSDIDDDPLTQPTALPVRRLEMRVSLPVGKTMLPTLRAWLNGIAAHVTPVPEQPWHRNSQVGLVFHFLKLADEQAGQDKCRRKAEDHAMRLCHLLCSYPGLRRFIVGIDAAGNERFAAPRQFAAAYRCLQQCHEQLRRKPGEPRLRLGWTFHAGEDADDMLTALRHIDECVRLLLPSASGGRLGHALLLGEPPREFYRNGRRAPEVSLGAHLLDLVWAQGKLAQHGSPAHIAWLRESIARYLGRQPAWVAIDACHQRMGWVDPCKGCTSESELLRELGLNKAAQTPLRLEIDEPWMDMVEEVQRLLRRELVQQCIAIEANPTSNLIVGGYSRYRDLPYRILVEDGLPLSINTDDPGLFISSLPTEFAAVYEALLAGMKHREALRWLQDRVDDAVNGSFLGLQVPVGQALTPGAINQALRYQ